MQHLLRSLRAKREAEENGFTLIELLVVVVIIGVLVAIAIPTYLNYRKGAADKAAQSDVRSAISTLENFYTTNNNTYPDTFSNKTGTITLALATVATTSTIVLSDNVTMNYTNNVTSYTLCDKTSAGTAGAKVYYDSSLGGAPKQVTSGAPAYCP